MWVRWRPGLPIQTRGTTGYPQELLTFRGQLKRRDKLTSIPRFLSPENSFERIFYKFVFVFEIWAIEIFVFTDSEGFQEITGKDAFDPASHTQRSRDVKHDLCGSLHVRFIIDIELCSVSGDH